MSQPTTIKNNIVIIGGGVAGLEVATAIARRTRRNKERISVTLVDRDASHIWKPMLHKVAAGTTNTAQQKIAFLAQAHSAGFSSQPGEMKELDRKAKTITLAPVLSCDGRELIPERQIPYDTLIIAIGSHANDFGTPGVNENCFMIDTRRQADAFNNELRIRLMQAMVKRSQLPITIVGGGATGVELAAELILLAEAAAAYGASDLPARILITLIESGPRLLASFPEDISQSTRQKLEAMGIRIMTNARVSAATADGFRLQDESFVPAALRIWAAGVKAPKVLKTLDGLEIGRNGQLIIKRSLQTTLDTDIYAIGDCASLTLAGEERPLPPTAQVAHQQARHLIRHLVRHIEMRKPIPDFQYQNFGSVVALGEYDAFASLGQFGLFKGMSLRGRLAQFSHILLYRSHQGRLYGFLRGSLIWLSDCLDAGIRSTIRLD
ncbi:NAD(P)/FAD-dependent oxidoreductase [Brucella intermedia]|uniref:NAD(P)/FAD-dependent oxidoreductase n=1 Tax=Brucella intermedia TaxID=94625 RepID=UPI00224B929D|nr:NAD(P)/FAD-dependent oxidoreductase [Brucella intermedia]